jgi:hypothetical protein
MALEVAPPSPDDTTATGDEELPRTVPIRALADATQQAVDLPEPGTEVDTQNMRFVPHAQATPPEPPQAAARRSKAQPTPPAGVPRRKDRAPAPSLAVARPKLRVLRGQKVNAEYPLYDGKNFLGRRDDEPIDVDLTEQEPTDRIWASRQHAAIYLDGGELQIEDLHSRNGTFLNRTRLVPGAKRPLQVNDVIQIGTIQMRVTV